MGKRLSVLLLASMLLSLLVPAAQAAGAAGGIDVYFYEEAAGAYGALTQTDLVTLTLDGAPLAPTASPRSSSIWGVTAARWCRYVSSRKSWAQR